jgi:hypothetical protein
MKNILKNILFLVFGLSLIACVSEKDNPRNFNIKNNSSKTIYYGLSYSQTDFSLKGIDFVPGANGNVSHKIKTNEQNTARVGSSIMQVYIFDSDVIESTPWDTIVKYNKFLKRYQFTQSELEKMNWEVIYDGK